MEAAALRERITDKLIDQIEGAMYPSVTMLNRVEATLTTPDDLADYAETLVKKVEESGHPSIEMLNRLDRVLNRLEQLEQRQRDRE